jgi:hypothetical protein
MKQLILLSIAWLLMQSVTLAAYATVDTRAGAVGSRIVVVHNPAAHYGVHIGDVLTQRVVIDTAENVQVELARLPKTGQRETDIVLIAMTPQLDTQSAKTRTTLTLQYQVFHPASEVTKLSLPALAIPLSDGSVLRVPAWQFWYAPLAKSSFLEVKNELMPFARPPLYDVAQSRTIMLTSLALMIASLLALCYLKLDLNWLPLVGGPFSRAHTRIRKQHKQVNADRLRQMLCELHAALDRVYGQSFFEKDIAVFIAKTPRYAPATTALQAFFVLSNQWLFAQGDDPQAAAQHVLAVSKLLRDCERGAA